MPATDDPLKNLVHDFAPDFAAWFLNVNRAAVQRVQPLNVELPARQKWSDTLFRVSLAWPLPTAEPTDVLLHVEFQGPRSRRPMPWRMVDYLGRIAERELGLQALARLPLCSTVLYIGEGAGRHDTGEYRVGCLDGSLTLAWRYRVIRLWQMPAEELLALARPALLTLLGQTHIEKPERVVPQAVEALAQVADADQRSRLFGLLISLIRDEEVMVMAERLIARIERDPWLNTPFLRRLRTEGRVEGRTEGRTEGRVEGEAKGLAAAVLDTLSIRLAPPAPTYRRLETQITGLTDPARLRELLGVALRATDIAEFEAALAG
jgi:hypothetical protein